MRNFFGLPILLFFIFGVVLNACTAAQTLGESSIISPDKDDSETGWQEKFDLSKCTLSTQRSSEYFILELGFQLVLEGGIERRVITVLAKPLKLMVPKPALSKSVNGETEN
jgi:hypothetical protein